MIENVYLRNDVMLTVVPMDEIGNKRCKYCGEPISGGQGWYMSLCGRCYTDKVTDKRA